MRPTRDARTSSAGGGESVNAYTRQVARRAAAREAGLDAEVARGLHRNAAESAFASLMLRPERRVPTNVPAAGSFVVADEAPQAPGRRRAVIWLLVALSVAAAQAFIIAGWWWVFRTPR